ncbi:MAG: glutamate 5-kinase [Bacteroidota bacterium]
MKDIFFSGDKIVVKIGTNLLADKTKGINHEKIDDIARSVSSLISLGKNVAIVSSGAIGAGLVLLGMKERPKAIPEKQAAAAIGQPILMEAYENAFRKYQRTIGQILLTKDDFVSRPRYVNIKNTFSALFENGVIPIVNENDTVAVEEIKLGDNDNLSALVANLIEADLLIVLSDVDGLYTDDPSKNPNAELISVVDKVTTHIEKLARKHKSELGTGGMITKIRAAKQCVSAGIGVIIANGNRPNILNDIISGNFPGTFFLPAQNGMNGRKKWIGFVSDSKGVIVVDPGAKNALLAKQKSLLPSGVVEVRGDFKIEDTISVLDTEGNEIARGIAGYSASDLDKIKGKKTSEIQRILNRKSGDEVIHRDNLVLIGTE